VVEQEGNGEGEGKAPIGQGNRYCGDGTSEAWRVELMVNRVNRGSETEDGLHGD
jgi:hypothetical protein